MNPVRKSRTPRRVALGAGALLATLVSGATDAHAFGATAHRAIGRIADRHLSPAAAAGVRALLGSESLAQVSTWSDEIRSDPSWAHASPWHYVTIEDGETYDTSAKNPKGDVIEAIRRHLATLRDAEKPALDRTQALKWLVHLVGDVHQPLHVGRGDDRGGNNIEVEWFNDKTNLHTVWDTKIVESTKLSFTEFADFIDTSDAEEVARWQRSNLMDWVSESIDLRGRAYTPPDPSYRGTYAYIYRNLPLVRLRTAQAGVRLAGLLNEVFAATGEAEELPPEYAARVAQVYTHATQQLERLASQRRSADERDWAVSIDIDAAIATAGSTVRPLPGAMEFLRRARERHARVVVVGRRSEHLLPDTEERLRRLGIPFDIVLLTAADHRTANEASWKKIAEGSASRDLRPADILLYVGDDLNDFPDAAEGAARLETFGRRDFLLPAPPRR